MPQPCDKAATGLTDDYASAMVATHAGTSTGAFDLTHRVPDGVTSITATPMSDQC